MRWEELSRQAEEREANTQQRVHELEREKADACRYANVC
jgi:hypothetical protein